VFLLKRDSRGGMLASQTGRIIEGVNGMGKGRKIVALVMAIAALVVTLGAPAAAAAPNCSPGQHGNPHPGFKPGSC